MIYFTKADTSIENSYHVKDPIFLEIHRTYFLTIEKLKKFNNPLTKTRHRDELICRR